jgi:hypothetical protein
MSDRGPTIWLNRVRESAKTGDRPFSCAKSERLRVDNSDGTCERKTICSALRSLCILSCSAWLMSGCLADSFRVIDPLPAVQAGEVVGEEVLLEVDDAGVKWGSGKVGDGLKAALVKNRTFGEVHYPIYPTHKVPLKLRVVLNGNIRADEGSGIMKAAVTGLFLFLPVGILQYEDIFSLDAMVSLSRDSRSYGPVAVQSAVEVDHILFSDPNSYTTQASDLALDHLAGRISILLRQHLEWFSP